MLMMRCGRTGPLIRYVAPILLSLLLSLLSAAQIAVAQSAEFSCVPKHWCHITVDKQVCGKYAIGRMAKRLLFIPDQGVWLDTLKHDINPGKDAANIDTKDSGVSGDPVASAHFSATHLFTDDADGGTAAGGKRALLYKKGDKLIAKVTNAYQTDISVFECSALEE